MKTINQHLLVLMAAVLLSSCIERYLPVTELDFHPRLVIDGNINTDGSDQEIVISESSPTENPVFVPVSGCKVSVEDGKGNSFVFNESNNKGHYLGKIDVEHIVIGEKYRLRVKTSMGIEYVSSYEELMPCPEVDRVYYDVEAKQTENPEITENGLQFYIDFKGDANSGHFYRWQLTQTYEYHSKWPIDKWLGKDGFHDLVDPDYSNFVCYKTDKLKSIYVLSTDGFSQNKFSKYKLHYVQDQTDVLMFKYSLLVNQYSLTERAYNYWENLRKNNQETVDLFGKQPANVKGNIYNVNDTTDIALGYFGISSVKSKRIMVTPVDGLSFNRFLRCQAEKIDIPLPAERPLYYVTDYDENGNIYTGLGAPICIFCTMLNGTTVKPPYWDEK